ncbi:MAG TPA: hypothetical protein VIC05_02595 [Solirubrobacteraceae bacterium]
MRSRLLSASCLALTLAIASCQPASAGKTQREALLNGRIALCGGPAPGAFHISMLGVCKPRCLTLNRVRVLDGKRRRGAHTVIHKGRFHLQLAPGSYTVMVGWSDGRSARSLRVSMRSGRVTRVKFTFAIP